MVICLNNLNYYYVHDTINVILAGNVSLLTCCGCQSYLFYTCFNYCLFCFTRLLDMSSTYFSTKTYVVDTQRDGSSEHQKQMFKLMDKKIITILRPFSTFIGTYVIHYIYFQGDGNISYYELEDEVPHCHFLNLFASSAPQRGLGKAITKLFYVSAVLHIECGKIYRFSYFLSKVYVVVGILD